MVRYNMIYEVWYIIVYLVVQLAVVVVVKPLEGVLQSPLIQRLPAGAGSRDPITRDTPTHITKNEKEKRAEHGRGGGGGVK